MSEEAIALFNKIADTVQNKNDLVTLVDDSGFTPFLRFIQTFATNGSATLNSFFNKLKEEKIAKKQEEWDKKHGTVKKAKKEKRAAKLRGGARTKQTARRVFGAPVSSRAARVSRPAAAAAMHAISAEFDSRPVSLSQE